MTIHTTTILTYANKTNKTGYVKFLQFLTFLTQCLLSLHFTYAKVHH